MVWITNLFANMIRILLGILLFISGIAAFGLSVSTTVFVISHVFPNPWIAIIAGIGLDLAKITSIFMNNMTEQMDREKRLINRVWRITLLLIAVLFTCITISGMLLNKNENVILSERQQQLDEQYQVLIDKETDRYEARAAEINADLDFERKTGIGERYEALEKELETLTENHMDYVYQLSNELEQKNIELSKNRFEGDRRKNDALIDNFKETINDAFNLKLTYTWWILIIVGIIAVTLELTMYVIFDIMGRGLESVVKPLRELSRAKREYDIAQKQSDVDFGKKSIQIKSDSAFKKLINATEAGVLEDKIENEALRIKNEIDNTIDEMKNDQDTLILTSLKGTLKDVMNRRRKKTV